MFKVKPWSCAAWRVVVGRGRKIPRSGPCYLGQNLVMVERPGREHDLRATRNFTMIVRNAAVRHGESIELN